jgi:hypothetical protein
MCITHYILIIKVKDAFGILPKERLFLGAQDVYKLQELQTHLDKI